MSAKSKKNKKDHFPSRNVGSTNQTASGNAWATNAVVVADQKVATETKKQSQLKQFNDIRKKHIEAAKIHTENYESSSEEELENDSLLTSVFKGYGGDKNQLQKTQEFLENVFQSGTATCLICIARVKRTDYVSLHGNPSMKPEMKLYFIISFLLDLVMRKLLQFFPLELFATVGTWQYIHTANAARERCCRLLQQSGRIYCEAAESNQMVLSKVQIKLSTIWGETDEYGIFYDQNLV